jgi:hypothetical protein
VATKDKKPKRADLRGSVEIPVGRFAGLVEPWKEAGMATPTLGGTPSILNLCNSDNFGADGTDADIKKEGAASVAWNARGDAETISYTVSNVALSTEHIRLWLNNINVAYMEAMELLVVDGSNSGWWDIMNPANYEGGWKYCIIYGGSSPGRNSGTPPAMTSVDSLGLTWQQTGLPANKINTWTDAWYYGDGYYATGGGTSDKITLATIRAVDVASAYGIVDAYQGIYFCTGALTIGNGSTTTYFEMSNQVLVFIDAPVNTGLYKLVGAGTGCNILLQGSVLRAAGSTDATRFLLDMSDTDIADFEMTGCFITRAGACTFQSGQDVSGNAFSDCGQITPDGADLSGCVVSGYEGSSDSAAVVWDLNTDPNNYLDGTTFTKGTASTHAIEFGDTIPSEITLTDVSFSGYNASDDQNDSTLYFADTGGTIILNLFGCSGDISIKTAGCDVSVVQDPVTTEITVKNEAGSLLTGARVYLIPTDNTGPLPYQEAVTISVSSGTATVTHTAHGVANGKKVLIEGATATDLNGTKTITWISANSYSYSTTAGDTSDSGTATGVIFNDLTASGVVTDSRVLSDDQDVQGWVRYASADYKTSIISGTIDNTSGLAATVVMVSDA